MPGVDAWQFECAIQDAVALERREFAGGVALLNPELPRVYDANFVRFDQPLDASAVAEIADDMLASFAHRKVVLPESASVAADELRAEGWTLHTLVTMEYRGGPSSSPPAAELLSPSQLREARHQAHDDIERDLDATRQIIEFTERMASVVPTQMFGARPRGSDEIGAYCCLFQRDGIGQIDEVTTIVRHREQGLGNAVVRAALAASLAAGDSLLFLVADEADWPREWYERLGFETTARRYELLRATAR